MFDFDKCEEILEKVGKVISILFLKDSSLSELKLLSIVNFQNLIDYQNLFGIGLIIIYLKNLF